MDAFLIQKQGLDHFFGDRHFQSKTLRILYFFLEIDFSKIAFVTLKDQ